MSKFFKLKCEFDVGEINNEEVANYLNILLTDDDFDNSYIIDEDEMDTDEDILYCCFDESKVDKMISILNDQGFFVSKHDITRDVLYNDLHKHTGLDKVPFVNEFVQRNITKDDILDKLNDRGFVTLSDFEKEFLSK